MEIIRRLRSKLDALTSENHPPRGELMKKAVRYSIDNSIAQQFIRPLAGGRKNSLFLGSCQMGQRISRIPYTDLNLQDERYIGTRLFEKNLPRNYLGAKGLRESFAYDYRN